MDERQHALFGLGARDENPRFGRRDFWRKVRRTAGRIPFVEDAVAAYYCAMDPLTPASVRAVLLGALVYFVVPTDLIPDFLAHIGFGDDAAVVATAIAMVGPHIKDRHRGKARKALDREAAAGGEEGG